VSKAASNQLLELVYQPIADLCFRTVIVRAK
jgi:hypothetical protein